MNPKLRPVETQWIEEDGQPVLVLIDRLGLCERTVGVPAQLAPLLALCDGSRDAGLLRAAYELRTGMRLPNGLVERLVEQLDDVLLLESPRYEAALREVVDAYRALPYRPPALAGLSYPAEPDELTRLLDGYGEGIALPAPEGEAEVPPIRGVICPHIDYPRGGPVYARTWLRAARAVREAEVVVVFGTDHLGSGGTLTLTRQRYATPWGPLPPATGVVEAMADALGEKAAFAEELHHRSEHSLELALVWLHYLRGGLAVEVVPILCGSFHPFIDGEADPAGEDTYERAILAAREALRGWRVLVVAAADLAHVGPAFGDERPLAAADRERLAHNDERRLAAACGGDPAAFLAALREDRDAQRVCGLPPIYFALRLLGGATGEVVDYAQCPADAEGGSLVSIGGVVLR